MSIATASDVLGRFPQALCRGVGPEIFFPEKGEAGKAAKKICASCVHSQGENECLEEALTEEKVWGIRGGKSEAERRAILKARKQKRKML